MRKLLLILTLIFGFTAPVVSAGSTERAPAPEVTCTSNPVWVTYGDPLVFPCDPTTQTVHVKWLPSTMTLSAAHTWCTDRGGVAVHTRYAATANVCEDIDY